MTRRAFSLDCAGRPGHFGLDDRLWAFRCGTGPSDIPPAMLGPGSNNLETQGSNN